MSVTNRILTYMGSTDANVGRKFYEPESDKIIIVTSYISDDTWFFKEYSLAKKRAKGEDIKSDKLFNFYIHHKLEEE